MRTVLVLCAVALAGCDRAAHDAEAQYEIVRNSPGTYGSMEKCKAAEKVADAWLAAKNTKKYEDWKSRSESLCLFARM